MTIAGEIDNKREFERPPIRARLSQYLRYERLGRYHLIAVGLLMLLGYALRVKGLGAQSIWYDEGYSIYLARQSIRDIWTNIIADHEPLYFWLLHLWLPLVGQSEFAVRYLSLIAGVLAIPLSYAVARAIAGRGISVIVALLAATSPFYVYYSQEARMYTMMLALSLVIVYACCQMRLARGRRYWLFYVAATTALAYTHYYGLLMPVFLNAVFLVALLRRCLPRQASASNPSRAMVLSWATAQLAWLILYAPWALRSAHLFNDFVGASQSALTPSSMFWNAAIAFGLGHSVERLNASAGDVGYVRDHQQALLLSVGLIAVVIIGALARFRRPPTAQKSSLLPFGFSALWLTIPAIAFYVLAAGKRDFTARYLITAAPAYQLLLAMGIGGLRHLKRALLVLGVAAVLAVTCHSLWNYYTNAQYWRDDHRAAVQYVEQHANHNEAIVLDASYFYPAFDYYFRGAAPRFGLPETHPPDRGQTEAVLRELGDRYDYLWLVLWQDYFSDPDRIVESYLDSQFIRNHEQTFGGNIKVRGYSTGSPISQEAVAGLVPVGQNLAQRVELVGYTLGDGRISGGRELSFTLYWRALQSMSEDYTVFAHLVNGAGQVIAQADSPPAHGRFPTSKMPVGVTVADEHSLAIPPGTPPGDYALLVGLYDSRTMRRLGEGDKNQLRLSPLRLERGVTTLPVSASRMDVDFSGTIRLVGYELNGQAAPGGTLTVALYWQGQKPVSDDLTAFVHVINADGKRLAQDDSQPAAGSYPTKSWQVGEMVRDRHEVSLPPDLPSGQYSVVVGLYDQQTGRRLTFRQLPWMRQADNATLTKVSVLP